MAESWTINVSGQVYGPYSLQDMRKLAADGRLAAHSQVAQNGETIYHSVLLDAELAGLFGGKSTVKSPPVLTENSASDVPERSRFVIVANMKTRSSTNIEKRVKKLGTVCPLSSQSWLLITDKQINALRDMLLQELGNLDTLCIIDATHNKAVWCNFDPQGESQIRQVWLSPS